MSDAIEEPLDMVPLGAADQVAVAVRRRILDGSLVPGQRLVLRTLADELGVSFIPVREALRTLESQGLVVARPGRSTVVASLSAEELASIYRLRLHIEPELAFRAAGRLTSEATATLEQLLVDLCDPASGPDEIYDAHHHFHAELLGPVTTEWDVRILETLWHASERYVRPAFFASRDRMLDERELRYTSHRRLLDTFLSADGEQSATELRRHLQKNQQRAAAALHL